MSALLSSNVTIAVLSLSETSALATPGTASRLFLTTNGQSAQYIFFTANVTVLSAARAVDVMSNPNDTDAISLIITGFSVHMLSSRGASKSMPRATTTSMVATIRPALTNVLAKAMVAQTPHHRSKQIFK